jgi:hypothetical protein
MWYFELTWEEDFVGSHVIEVLMEIHKNRRFNHSCFVLLFQCKRTDTYGLSHTQPEEDAGVWLCQTHENRSGSED